MTNQDDMQAQPMALDDLVVLDLTDEKGMYLGKLLADMGARVTIVEPPAGHPARHIGPFYQDRPDPNNSLLFWYNSTNKESITLDITTSKGAQLLREMVKKSDVLLESFQPGYLDSLGLGYETLSKINPRLIMTSVTGFGQTGPYRDMKTSDLVAMAMGGPMASSGYDHIPDAPPICCDGWIGYATACNFGAMGTLTALFYRDLTGQGQWVDVSIHESLSCTTEGAMPNWFYDRQVPMRQTGRHHGLVPSPSTQFESSDGKLVNGFDIPPRSLDRWNRMVAWMDEKGMAEELKDESYRELISKGARSGPEMDFMRERITDFIASQTADEAYHGGQKIRLAWAVIRSPEENVEDPHFRDDRGFFPLVEHPELHSSFAYPGAPAIFSRTPWRIRRRAPLLGEDNEKVFLGELGLSHEELVMLRESRVV
jgi:crotonobetainyl-CoA:carnitine CoA-transferase CaiB-like acyl-CoA transferase